MGMAERAETPSALSRTPSDEMLWPYNLTCLAPMRAFEGESFSVCTCEGLQTMKKKRGYMRGGVIR